MIGMSTMAMFASTSSIDDWLFAGGVLVVSYLVLYPLYLLFVRIKHTRRIKSQLVTSLYKVPLGLSPAELSYVFSTRVSKAQLYGTLLDLANRSILVLDKNETGAITVSIGPKIEKELKPHEKLLYGHAQGMTGEVPLERVLQGFTTFKPVGDSEIRGSRQYVFWWLLRDDMRKRKLISKHMTAKYIKMLAIFGFFWSLILSTVPLLIIHILVMLDSGEVDFSHLSESFRAGLTFWLIALPMIILTSFFLLRFRGRMLGREWLMTSNLHRYLQQLEAYREFVRLTHKGTLRFESKELQKEARAITRPYAIAFGYVKD